jgi:hypothetical protein
MSDPIVIPAQAGWEHLLWISNYGPGVYWRSAIVGWRVNKGAVPVTATLFPDGEGVIAERVMEGTAGFGLRRPDGSVEDDGHVFASEGDWLAAVREEVAA